MVAWLSAYFLNTTYRVVLQALGMSHSKLPTMQKNKYTLCFVFYRCISCEAYILTNQFRQRRTRREQMALFLQMTVPLGSIVVLTVAVKFIVYPLHNKHSKESALRRTIALFAPLIGVESYLKKPREFLFAAVLLAPLYCSSAIMYVLSVASRS